MDDKDINYFEPNTPLVLKEELNIPLVLKDEINLNTINNKNNEILKIKNLIKHKYLLTEKNKSDEINYHLDKDFNYIKNTAKEINNDIRKKTLKINKEHLFTKKKIFKKTVNGAANENNILFLLGPIFCKAINKNVSPNKIPIIPEIMIIFKYS